MDRLFVSNLHFEKQMDEIQTLSWLDLYRLTKRLADEDEIHLSETRENETTRGGDDEAAEDDGEMLTTSKKLKALLEKQHDSTENTKTKRVL